MWLWRDGSWAGGGGALHGILTREAESESVGVSIFLLKMEYLYVTCQPVNLVCLFTCPFVCFLFYLLTRILRGASFFFVHISAAILQTAFLLITQQI